MIDVGTPLSETSIFDEKLKKTPRETTISFDEELFPYATNLTDKKKSKSFYKKEGLIKRDFRLPEPVKALGKGVIKGGSQLATLSPFAQGPISSQLGEELTEETIPTEDTFATRLAERTGKLIPQVAIGGGGGILPTAVRTGIGALLGQTLEEAGGPRWLQDLGELLPFALPGLGQKILPKKGQEALVDFARQQGFTEAELAPALIPKDKGGILAKFTPRRGRTQTKLQKTRNALDRTYENLKGLPESEKGLNLKQQDKIINEFSKIIDKVPAEDFDKIERDYNRFISKPITGDSIINFQVALNKASGKNPLLSQLKNPLNKASKEIGENFAENLRFTNELYGNYKTLSNRLKPTIFNDILTSGRKTLQLVLGISTGNYGLLTETIGEHAARQLSRELLLNPRFKNLSGKMINALNSNKIKIANRIANELIKNVKKEFPDIEIEEKADFSNQIK